MEPVVQNHTIKNDIRHFILSNFLPNHEDKDLDDNDLLFESGIVDSAGAMMLIAFIDDQFNISVPDEELFPENFASVTHIIKYIEMKLNKRKNASQPEMS